MAERTIQRPHGHHLRTNIPWKGRACIRIVRRNMFLSSSRIRVELIRQSRRSVSAGTVKRHLVAAGYLSRCLARCPRLTHDHRCQRRIWARRHRNWNHRWSHVIFADESRFIPNHCYGCGRVRRRAGEWLVDCCIQEMDGNVGPSLMVWNAFHPSGKSQLVVVDGTVNQQCHIGILRQNLFPWARATSPRKFSACTWQRYTPYGTKYTHISSRRGGWGHAVACSWTWSKPHRTCLGPEWDVY